MCCLRYEYEAYKDFHGRAPKKNARIETPDGEGKVVDLDVPREIVSIKVGDEKPVKVPLADMEPPEEGARPNAVGEEAWERANEPATLGESGVVALFSSNLTGEDKLAEPGSVRHVHEGDEKKRSKSRSRRRGGSGKEAAQARRSSEEAQGSAARKPRRRRSTTVSSDGEVQVERSDQQQSVERSSGDSQKSSPRRRSRRSSNKAQGQAASGERQQKSQVGRNSSALRAGRTEGQGKPADGAPSPSSGRSRRRRRSHKPESDGE